MDWRYGYRPGDWTFDFEIFEDGVIQFSDSKGEAMAQYTVSREFARGSIAVPHWIWEKTKTIEFIPSKGSGKVAETFRL